jgi:hypothetical protein
MTDMPVAAKRYAYAVIIVGGVVLALSLLKWSPSSWISFGVYFTLSIIASMVKFTPPGINGTYSVSFLLTLAGIAEFTLPETLIATCAGALIQSLWKVKQRPSTVQVLFSMANLTISTSLCFVIAHSVLVDGLQAYRPAVLALVAAIHFAMSTVLVSGVLALLRGQPLHEVYREWYFWSFPYYLIGAAVVGLLPLSGKVPAPEGWLILMPLLYLVHFYYRLGSDPAPVAASDEPTVGGKLPPVASVYIDAVITCGAMIMIYAGAHWESANLSRFLGYLAMALLAGMYKVRLPRLTSTISVSFVLILVAIAELSYAEAVAISAAVALVQTLWKARRSPKPVRIAFNCASLVVSTSAAYWVCHAVIGPEGWVALPTFLVIATALLFAANSTMVAAVVCLAEGKPMRMIWQQCYFWSFPYYLVGAAASGLMIGTARSAGWPFSFLVLPILTMIYVSYRLHARPKAVAAAHA